MRANSPRPTGAGRRTPPEDVSLRLRFEGDSRSSNALSCSRYWSNWLPADATAKQKRNNKKRKRRRKTQQQQQQQKQQQQQQQPEQQQPEEGEEGEEGEIEGEGEECVSLDDFAVGEERVRITMLSRKHKTQIGGERRWTKRKKKEKKLTLLFKF